MFAEAKPLHYHLMIILLVGLFEVIKFTYTNSRSTK